MKKILSIILSLAMLLSTASFAAPSMADPVASIEEDFESSPVVSDDDTNASLNDEADYGTLVYDINFNSASTTTFGSSVTSYGSVNAPSAFPDAAKTTLSSTFASSTVKDGKAVVTTASSGYPRLSINSPSGVNFPYGQYTIFCDYTKTSEANNGSDVNISLRGAADKSIKVLKPTDCDTHTLQVTFDHLDSKVAIKGGSTLNYSFITALQFYVTAKGTDTFEIDNIKVYYKAPVTVSFNGGDVSTEEVDDIQIILGDALSFDKTPAFKSVGDYQHIGWSLEKGGDLIKGTDIVIDADTTLYAVWQDMTHDKHGDLLYSIDFEKAASFTSGDLITSHGFVNTSYPDSDKWTVSNTPNQSTNPHLVTENGNTFLQITSLTSSYPMICTNSSAGETFVFAPNGVYTMVQDIQYRVDTAEGVVSSNPSFRWTNCFAAEENHDTSKVKGQGGSVGSTSHTSYKDEWYTVTAAQKLTTHPDGASYTNEGLYCTQAIYQKTNSSATKSGDHFLADNMKLYWKPFTANVTLKVVGSDKVSETTVTWDTTKALTKDTVASYFSDEALICGISRTQDADVENEIWVTGDTTVYVHFVDLSTKHEQHGDLLFLIDFDNIDTSAAAYIESGDYKMLKEATTLDGMAVVNPAIADLDMANTVIEMQSCNSYSGASTQHMLIEKDESGNAYGSVYGTNAYMLGVIRNDDNKAIYKDGTYTLVYDVEATKKITMFKDWFEYNYTNASNKLAKTQMSVEIKANNEADVTHEHTSILSKAFADSMVPADDTNDYQSISGIAFGVNTEAKGATVKFDNIKLYWKPSTATVTINMNGNTEAEAEAYKHDTSEKLSLAALAEYVGDTVSYTLKGFSQTADGEVLTQDMWVNGDITLYAVWEEKTDVTPETVNDVSIRTDSYTGIRFKGSITQSKKNETDEYGFIVTLESLLGSGELTHESGVKYVEGKNYIKAEDKDVIFDTVDDNIFFTAVVYNVPETKAAYTSNFIARAFTKRDGFYYYGNAVTTSICDVAITLRDGGYENMSEGAISTVKNILTICGESTDAPAV